MALASHRDCCALFALLCVEGAAVVEVSNTALAFAISRAGHEIVLVYKARAFSSDNVEECARAGNGTTMVRTLAREFRPVYGTRPCAANADIHGYGGTRPLHCERRSS